VHKVEVSPAADRDVERLKQRIQRHTFERLRTAIKSLVDEPRPHEVRKIEGAEKAYRMRVGDYRVLYEI
jgi:mRNA interferase RelE/StbE